MTHEPHNRPCGCVRLRPDAEPPGALG